MLRSGVIAKKLGMTRVYAEDGSHVPVSVLSLEGCQVVAQKRWTVMVISASAWCG